jgi:hypothetical protein
MPSAIATPTYASKTSNITNAGGISLQSILNANDAIAFKANPTAPCLKKVVVVGQDTNKANNSQVQIAAGTYIRVGENLVSFASDTAVDTAWIAGAGVGTDWGVFVKADGTTSVVDVTNEDLVTLFAPRTIGGLNAALIGGFHFGLATEAVALNGTGNALGNNVGVGADTIHSAYYFSGTNAKYKPNQTQTWLGEIWTQTLLNRVKCVNTDSFWDLRFRPGAIDPRGFTLIGKSWIGIYPVSNICGTGTNGNKYRASKYVSAAYCASGSQLPTNPLTNAAYPSFNAWDAGDILLRVGCRLPTYFEFASAAAGVTEGVSLDVGVSTTPQLSSLTAYHHGTSLIGGHGMSGFHWIWGQEQRNRVTASGTFAWYSASTATTATQGRGSVYDNADDNMAQVLLGGGRDVGAVVGSRCSSWNAYPRNSGWYIGARAACDHL